MLSFFRRIKNSAFLITISTVVTFISYFSGLHTSLTEFLGKLGITNLTLIDIILLILILIILFIIVFLIDIIFKTYFNVDFISYETEPHVTFSSDASGERIHDYQKLRANAKQSIFVMGVGMTYFSADYSLLEKLLEKKISVRLLMMDPNILIQNSSDEGLPDFNICITEQHFNDYFLRRGFSSDIRSSFERLVWFIENRKSLKHKSGRIELRVYPYFIPLNYTIADESYEGEVIYELVIPFSDHRIRLNFNKKDHSNIFNSIIHDVEKLWDRSHIIISD